MLIINKLIKYFFYNLGYEIEPFAHSIWTDNQEFQNLFHEVKHNYWGGIDRLYNLWQLAKHAGNLEGDIAEVGVYRGGSAKVIAQACPNKKIHLFDTFSGMPQASELDGFKEGDFDDTSIELVRKFLADTNNVVFHQGVFPETTTALSDNKFCFVYADADLYMSIKDCLDFFYTKLIPGGIMVFDDFGVKKCPGVKKAIDEFFIDKKEKPIHIAKFQCIIIKV